MNICDKIKEGYNLFIRKTESDDLIGTLTLKEKDDYKYIEQLQLSEMNFILNYDTVNSTLDQEHAIFINYDVDKKQFGASIQEKTNIGKYNDIITWNNIVVCYNSNFSELIDELDKKI